MGRFRVRFHGRTLAAAVACASFGPTAPAVPPELAQRLPQNTAAAYFVSASPVPSENDNLAALRLASFLADQARRAGLLNQLEDTQRLWLDLFTAVSNVLDYPHVVALFDVSAAVRRDGRHKVVGLQAALILQTNGNHAPVEQRIQHLLTTYTNTEESTLTPRVVGSTKAFCLRDGRLPDWAVFNWGSLGPCYVVTVGEGAFERVIGESEGRSDLSLGSDEWFARAFSRARGPEAVFALYVAPERLGDESGSSAQNQIIAAARTLGLTGTERALWTVGQRGRAVEAVGIVHGEAGDRFHRIAGDEKDAALVASVVPARASSYAVINAEPAQVFHTAAAAYLAARSPVSRRRLEAFWAGVAEQTGVSIERDVLSDLTGPVVIHNDPQHALRLPFAWTYLFRIRGDAGPIRDRLDKLLNAAVAALAEDGAFQLYHHPDGIWSTQFGLTGPALLVTERWVIVSFSPEAVRQNRAFLGPPANSARGSAEDKTRSP